MIFIQPRKGLLEKALKPKQNKIEALKKELQELTRSSEQQAELLQQARSDKTSPAEGFIALSIASLPHDATFEEIIENTYILKKFSDALKVEAALITNLLSHRFSAWSASQLKELNDHRFALEAAEAELIEPRTSAANFICDADVSRENTASPYMKALAAALGGLFLGMMSLSLCNTWRQEQEKRKRATHSS